MKLVMVKIVKTPDVVAAAAADGGDDDSVKAFANYRSSILVLTRNLVTLDPLVCVRLCSERFAELLARPRAENNHLNEHGFSSLKSRTFLDAEGACMVLEWVLRGCDAALLGR
jgi:hypothetical protein